MVLGWEDDGALNGGEGDGEGEESGDRDAELNKQNNREMNEDEREVDRTRAVAGHPTGQAGAYAGKPDVGNALQPGYGDSPRRCLGESDW